MIRYLLLCLLLQLVVLHAAEPHVHLQHRVSTGSAPTIDGRLAAGEWDDAAKLSPFFLVDSRLTRSDLLNEVYLKFDRKALYIGFKTHAGIDLECKPTPNDSQSITGVECFDIRLIVKGQKKWRRFAVERSGSRLDQLIRGHIMDKPEEWNPAWEYKCHMTPMEFSSWSVWEGEIAIPWEALEIEYPAEGRRLSAMFIRYHGNVSLSDTAGKSRITSWNMGRDNVDLIFDANYGALDLIPGKSVFRFDSLKTFIDATGEVSGRLIGPASEKGGNLNVAAYDARNVKRMFIYSAVPFKTQSLDWKGIAKVKQKENASGRFLLNDADGESIAKTPMLNQITPPFSCDVLWNSTPDTVTFAGQMRDDFQNGDMVLFQIKNAAGKETASSRINVKPGEHFFSGELASSGIAEGETFTASASLLRKGAVISASVYSLNKKTPPWCGLAEKYKVTAPPIGWKPVKTAISRDEQITVEIFGHSCVFGDDIMPREVLLHGEKFSAAPWRFVAETSAGAQTFTGKTRLTGTDGRGASLRYEGLSEHLSLQADIRVEFDGMVWYSCKVAPRNGKPVTVSHLALSCPISPDKLRYLNGVSGATHRAAFIGSAKTDRDIPLPAISAPIHVSFNGWKFQESFNNFYWIGGDDRGCLFVLPSERNLSIDKLYNQLDDKPECATFSLELINKAKEIKGTVEYDFGFFLTPAHRHPQAGKLRVFGQYVLGLDMEKEHKRQLTIPQSAYDKNPKLAQRMFGRPAADYKIPADHIFADFIGIWNHRDICDGNFLPSPSQRALVQRQCRGIREGNHGKPVLWYDQQVTPLQDVTRPYLGEWRAWPVRDMLADVQVSKLCPTKAWTDAYLYGLEQYFADGGCHIYVDMSSINPCSNPFHGCGYIDENGKRQSTLPFMAYREFMLTVQNALKSNDPEAAVGFHGCGIQNLWTDQHIEGEYWQYAASYQTLTPEFYQLYNFTSHQIGSVGGIFGALIYQHVPGALACSVTQEDIIGLSLLHDSHVQNCHAMEIYGNVITAEPFLRFGADEPDCKWLPYWRNPMSRYPESPVAITSWKRGDRTLSVAFNTDAEKNEEVRLPEGKNTDMIKKAAIDSNKVTLKPRSLLIFLNEPQ